MTPPDLPAIAEEVRRHLHDGIIPFWSARAVDREHGGFLTCFDADGEHDPSFPDKYIVTQTRMIWAFSRFADVSDDADRRRAHLDAAGQGVDFFVDHFWDRVHGGWFWRTDRRGACTDPTKLTYGQSFAVYALAQHHRSTGDERSLDYACRTFDLLQRNAVDCLHGGWFENVGGDWAPLGGGSAGGDRKSLDIHMHLLEAFTELALATGDDVHRRRLREVRDLVLARMIDNAHGTGGNQFDLEFAPVAPIVIDRTWIAERPEPGGPPAPTDAISYGHDLELGWLLARADEVLGDGRGAHAEEVAALGAHAHEHGLDPVHGGVFREGLRTGGATDHTKEFWQNAEALPGWLEVFEQTGEARYLDAFTSTWRFASAHLIDHSLGEWRVRCDRDGAVLVAELGNPWKGAYHTGRACIESLERLERLAVTA